MSEGHTTRALRVIPPLEPMTLQQRIAQLQADLRAANAEQANALRVALDSLVAMAQAVAENPSQPAGRREIARALAESGESQRQTLAAILERTT